MDEQYKCPWCDVVKPLRGLACHVGKTHKQSVEELHRQVLHGGITPLCKCGCGQQVRWLQRYFGKYLRGHNSFSQAARDSAADARREKAERGELVPWNKGLTKETDERIARVAERIAATVDGVEISRRLAERSNEAKLTHRQNLSTALQTTYNEGRRAWNEGLTKETNASLASVASKNREHARRRFSWVGKPERVEDAAATRSGELRLLDADGYENKRSSLLFECKQCGSRIRRSLHTLRYSPGCPACAGHDTKPQLELYSLVKGICADAVSSDSSTISPLHLDVYVPSKKFAVEYNGLYWHSEKHRTRSYHQKKSEACSARHISLLHIYADDWRDRRAIVESMIRHRLGVTSRRVYARSCSVVQISAERRRAFFERCHLDGDVASKIAFGLELDGYLVATLSIRRPFHTKWKNCAEIARFATELDTVVVGGLSRLVKAVVSWARQNGYRRILSYVDGRVGEGYGYISAGFTKVGSTPPTFWWTDYHERFNRFNYRASKERGLTEQQIADEAGVVRIYGCQNAIMLMDLSSLSPNLSSGNGSGCLRRGRCRSSSCRRPCTGAP